MYFMHYSFLNRFIYVCMCNLLLSMINSKCVPSVVNFWWSLLSNSLIVFSVKRKCVFAYCRLDSWNHQKGHVSKDKTLFLASEVLHHIHGQHAGPLLAEAKFLFVSLSSNSALKGTEICVYSCFCLQSPTQQRQRPFSAISSAQNCASCLTITQVFNSHSCNNNIQCSITLVTFNRCSTVCAVMGVIPRFCTIKRT